MVDTPREQKVQNPSKRVEHLNPEDPPVLIEEYSFPRWFIWFASVFMSGALPWATWVTYQLIILVNSRNYQDPDLIRLNIEYAHVRTEILEIKSRLDKLEKQ